MFGGSYPGLDQRMTASLHPPHLVSIAPVASARPGVDLPLDNNILSTCSLQWLTLVSGRIVYGSVFTDDIWENAAKRLYLAKAPFNQFDRYAGSTTTIFQQWLQHPEFDSYWKKMAVSRELVAGIALPVLAITGTRDGDELGTLSFYADHITATEPKIIDNYYLVIGPWNHFGTREPKQNFGGQHYGTASLLDLMRLHRE